MRVSVNKTRGVMFRKPAFALLAITASFMCLAGAAQAASPAWKLLAATGPSNLPPKQSEVQRLTVEAEGGTFTLGVTAKGEGTPVFLDATLGLTAGSPVATIESLTGSGKVEVGDRVTLPEEYGGANILSCSSDCETLGSTIELSEPASITESGAHRQILTRELSGVIGSFQVGEEVKEVLNPLGEGPIPYFAPGTVVTAVNAGAGTMTLSNPTTGEYSTAEGTFYGPLRLTTGAVSAPIAFDASAGTVQSALSTALGAGSVKVTGGPGGDAATPYVIEFAGPMEERNVPQLESDADELDGEGANSHVFTIVQGGPGTGEIVVDPANVGGAPSSGLVTLRIGPLPAGIRQSAVATGAGWSCSEPTSGAPIVCTSSEGVPGIAPMESVSVPIEVEPSLATSTFVPIEILGGGGRADAIQLPIEISSTPAEFGTRSFWAGAFDSEGHLETQAGAHPYSAQTFFLLNTVRSKNGEIIPAGVLDNVNVDLPTGFSGNPLVTARCPQDRVAGEVGAPLCNLEMSVGTFGPIVSFLRGGAGKFKFPIFNDVPPRGSAAEFSTKIVTPVQSLLGSVRSDEDFGIRITAPNIANFFKIFGSYAGLEGQPASAHGRAFLTNPMNCAEEAENPPVTTMRAETYELPGVVSTSSVGIPPVVGCNRLSFNPGFTLQPSSTRGSSPVGATADLHVPQEGLTDPNQLAQPNLKKAVVTLPPGLDVNPSSANGLASCSEAQIGYRKPGEPGGKPLPANPTRFDKTPVTCPDASKIGTFKVKTPLLEEELEGIIYLAAQEENPFHSLIALYLVVESERFGVTLKLPGKVEPDPVTGQLTGIFDNNPQLPFEELTLNFRGGGPRSTLATPEVCGSYKTTGELTPWSAPESGPPAQIQEAGFTVGSGCASSAESRPFAPTLEAGTTGTQAGSYSPLVIKLSRKDGEQEIRNLEFKLPKGLTGKLAGIPYCPDSAIAAAQDKSGKAELADASCPSASQIGTVDAGAGVGSEPIHVGGKVYLAGPYKGAPLSSVVITPAVAGPFDLGNVVVRAPLYVDPETAEITAKSDPLPTILKGIPLKLRSVVINLDRSDFTLNPTSCDPMEVTATVEGNSGGTAKPANRFQVGGCDQLKFKPKLQVTLKGGTKRTGHPALKAVLTYPKHGAYANIRRAQVNLPHSEFLDQNNLNKTCTKPVLLEGKCPKKSIYGFAKAWTPLLDKPLEGPVYLVGGYGYKLPALVAELNGQIRVVLKGKVDSGPNKGIRNTFEAVPDAPVSRFVLEMKGGKKYGLLINSENLCKKPQRLLARFTAQNGKVDVSKPLIANSCGKGKKGKKGGKPKKKH